MKKVFIAIICMFFCANVFAKDEVTFDFSKNYDKDASEILTEYVEQFTKIFCPEAKAEFYDIDNDNKKEIVGYAKNGTFYSLEGYRLLILKESDKNEDTNTITINDKHWKMVPSDIYFEPDLPFKIDGDKITFKQTHFYKHRKQSAKIGQSSLKTRQDFSSINAKRVKKIAETIEFTNNNVQNNININEFSGSTQKNVNIFYSTLNPINQPRFKNEATFSNVDF